MRGFAEALHVLTVRGTVTKRADSPLSDRRNGELARQPLSVKTDARKTVRPVNSTNSFLLFSSFVRLLHIVETTSHADNRIIIELPVRTHIELLQESRNIFSPKTTE